MHLLKTQFRQALPGVCDACAAYRLILHLKKAIKKTDFTPGSRACGYVDMSERSETYPRDCGQPGGLSKALEGNPQGCPQGRQDRHIHRP
ncbi:MAG: hypothetical protein L5655_05720 [Thermosediminibacteraceae bacterium]|nr:hypothetical protein [Thermosediminibacteraceae bacterium]